MIKLFLLLFLSVSGTLSSLNFTSHFDFAQNVLHFLEVERYSLTATCGNHLEKYANALFAEEAWSLQMFVTHPTVKSDILTGHLTDLGAFDECLMVRRAFNESDIVFGKYCIGTVPVNLQGAKTTEELVQRIKNSSKSTTAIGLSHIQLSTCMPHTCNAQDIQKIHSGLGIDLHFKDERCQSKANERNLDQAAYVGIAFFGVITGIMFVSTVYETVLYYMQKGPYSSYLVAFSVLKNGKSLLATNKKRSGTSCLHGIRVLTTIWIMYSHSRRYFFSFPTNNYFDKDKWFENESNMYLIGWTSVDSFFVMAGLLVSYNFLLAGKNNKKFNIVHHYLHRYVRLTSVLLALLIFYITLMPYVGSGPLWPDYIDNNEVKACKRDWWKLMLYIQNYGMHTTSLCMSHSWYIAVDYQLFLLSPLLLLPLKKWPKFTLTLIGFLIVCSVCFAFFVSWFFELRIVGYANSRPTQILYFYMYYHFSTVVRAAFWLTGFALGYVIFKLKENKTTIQLNKTLVLIIWATCFITLGACAFGGHNLIFKYNKVESSIYLALVQQGWVFGVSWIIFGCFIGCGGPINWFLGLPFFELLSKLSFSMYMVNPAVLFVTKSQIRETTSQENLLQIQQFWGDSIATLIAGVYLMLAFELPTANIEKALLRKRKGNPAEGKDNPILPINKSNEPDS